MLPIVMQLGLFEKPMDSDDHKYSHKCLMWLLECLTNCNREFLKIHKDTPPLYKANVVYTRESGTEDWSGIKIGLRTKRMDCEDLACWRVAELREKGEAAKPRVKFKNVQGFWHYHIQVIRGDGRLEDPSQILGMNRSEGKPLSKIKMIATFDADSL